ncbi:MAG: hypothetical protein ACXVFT_25760 [Solirubrobacteraceae bacterium]
MFVKSKTRTAVTLAIAAGAAVAAPSAGARPADVGPPATAAASHATLPAPHTATRIVEVRSSGFDWGDAGLGAAGMLSLLGVGAGALVVTRRGRPTVT